MRNSLLFWVGVVVCASLVCVAQPDTSLISIANAVITQEAFTDAPDRYANFVQQAVDKLHEYPLPDKADGGGCSFTYRVSGSTATKQYTLVPNTLKVNILAGVVQVKARMTANIRVYVWAKAKKRIIFCFSKTVCDAWMTVSSTADITVNFNFLGSSPTKITATTQIDFPDFNVAGCQVFGGFWDWALNIRQRTIDVLKQNIQQAAADIAARFILPTTFSPYENVTIVYYFDTITTYPYSWLFGKAIAQLWVKDDYGVSHQWHDADPMARTYPPSTWTWTRGSGPSNLFTGLRVNSRILNALFWSGSIMDQYHFALNKTILDASLEGELMWSVPEMTVTGTNKLHFEVDYGRLFMECGNDNSADRRPILDFSFNGFRANGDLKMINTLSTVGVGLQITELENTNLKVNLSAPRLPVPQDTIQHAVEAGLDKATPTINEWLERNPLYMPADVAYLLPNAEGEVNLLTNPYGYVEFRTWCDCSGADFRWPPCHYNPCSGTSYPQPSNQHAATQALDPAPAAFVEQFESKFSTQSGDQTDKASKAAEPVPEPELAPHIGVDFPEPEGFLHGWHVDDDSQDPELFITPPEPLLDVSPVSSITIEHVAWVPPESPQSQASEAGPAKVSHVVPLHKAQPQPQPYAHTHAQEPAAAPEAQAPAALDLKALLSPLKKLRQATRSGPRVAVVSVEPAPDAETLVDADERAEEASRLSRLSHTLDALRRMTTWFQTDEAEDVEEEKTLEPERRTLGQLYNLARPVSLNKQPCHSSNNSAPMMQTHASRVLPHTPHTLRRRPMRERTGVDLASFRSSVSISFASSMSPAASWAETVITSWANDYANDYAAQQEAEAEAQAQAQAALDAQADADADAEAAAEQDALLLEEEEEELWQGSPAPRSLRSVAPFFRTSYRPQMPPIPYSHLFGSAGRSAYNMVRSMMTPLHDVYNGLSVYMSPAEGPIAGPEESLAVPLIVPVAASSSSRLSSIDRLQQRLQQQQQPAGRKTLGVAEPAVVPVTSEAERAAVLALRAGGGEASSEFRTYDTRGLYVTLYTAGDFDNGDCSLAKSTAYASVAMIPETNGACAAYDTDYYYSLDFTNGMILSFLCNDGTCTSCQVQDQGSGILGGCVDMQGSGSVVFNGYPGMCAGSFTEAVPGSNYVMTNYMTPTGQTATCGMSSVPLTGVFTQGLIYSISAPSDGSCGFCDPVTMGSYCKVTPGNNGEVTVFAICDISCDPGYCTLTQTLTPGVCTSAGTNSAWMLTMGAGSCNQVEYKMPGWAVAITVLFVLGGVAGLIVGAFCWRKHDCSVPQAQRWCSSCYRSLPDKWHECLYGDDEDQVSKDGSRAYRPLTDGNEAHRHHGLCYYAHCACMPDSFWYFLGCLWVPLLARGIWHCICKPATYKLPYTQFFSHRERKYLYVLEIMAAVMFFVEMICWIVNSPLAVITDVDTMAHLGINPAYFDRSGLDRDFPRWEDGAKISAAVACFLWLMASFMPPLCVKYRHHVLHAVTVVRMHRIAALIGVAALIGQLMAPPFMFLFKDCIVVTTALDDDESVRSWAQAVVGYTFSGVVFSYLANFFLVTMTALSPACYLAASLSLIANEPDRRKGAASYDTDFVQISSPRLARVRTVVILVHCMVPIACIVPVIIIYQTLAVRPAWAALWPCIWAIPFFFIWRMSQNLERMRKGTSFFGDVKLRLMFDCVLYLVTIISFTMASLIIEHEYIPIDGWFVSILYVTAFWCGGAAFYVLFFSQPDDPELLKRDFEDEADGKHVEMSQQGTGGEPSTNSHTTGGKGWVHETSVSGGGSQREGYQRRRDSNSSQASNQSTNSSRAGEGEGDYTGTGAGDTKKRHGNGHLKRSKSGLKHSSCCTCCLCIPCLYEKVGIRVEECWDAFSAKYHDTRDRARGNCPGLWRTVSNAKGWLFETYEDELRLPFRRLCLLIGLSMSFYLFTLALEEVKISGKEFFQKTLASYGYDLQWPSEEEGGTLFDKAFAVFDKWKWVAFALTTTSFVCVSIAFISDTVFDNLPVSRFFSFLCLPFAFVGMNAVAIPNYLDETDVGSLFPSCAPQFDMFLQMFVGMLIGVVCSVALVIKLVVLMLTVSPSVIRVCVLTLTDLHMKMPKADFVVTPRQRFKMTAPRPATLPSGPVSVCWRIETLDKQTREPVGVFAELRRDVDEHFTKAKLYIPRLFLNSNNLYRFISIMATPSGAKPETHSEDVVCVKAIPPTRADVVQTQHSLMNIIGFASMLSPILAGLPLMMVYQVVAAPSVSVFIVIFWLIPVIVATRINQNNFFPVYVLYCQTYLGTLLGLLIEIARLTGVTAASVYKMLESPAFWCELISEVALCNVVLGDLLYVNLFKYAKRAKPPTMKRSETKSDMLIETDTTGETEGEAAKKAKAAPQRKNPWENSRPVRGGVCPDFLKCRPCRRVEPRCQKLLSLLGILHCWIRVCLGKKRYMERMEERKQRNPYKWKGAAPEDHIEDPLDLWTKLKRFINRRQRASPNDLHILLDKETLNTLADEQQPGANGGADDHRGGGGVAGGAPLPGFGGGHSGPGMHEGENQSSRVNSWNPGAKAPPPPPLTKVGASGYRAAAAGPRPGVVKTMVVAFNPSNAKVLGDFKYSRKNLFPPKPIGNKRSKHPPKPPKQPRRFSNSSVADPVSSMADNSRYEPSVSSRAPPSRTPHKAALSPNHKPASQRALVNQWEEKAERDDPPSYAPTPTSVLKDAYLPPAFQSEASFKAPKPFARTGTNSSLPGTGPRAPASPTHRSMVSTSSVRSASPQRSASPPRSASPGHMHKPSTASSGSTASHSRKSSKGAFCTGCGRPFSASEKFCIHCGAERS